jgi:hypothetical protein
MCLPLYTRFGWCVEKCTLIWVDAKCLALFAVHIDVMPRKINMKWNDHEDYSLPSDVHSQ